MPTPTWATDAGSTPSENRLFIYDRDTRLKFLVDSGSVVSLLPKRAIFRKLPRQDLVLYAANTSPIATYGHVSMHLDYDSRKQYSWAFIVADVDTAILGADFIRHHGLLVDLRGQRLLDPTSGIFVAGTVGPTMVHSVSTVAHLQTPHGPTGSRYADLMRSFADLASPVESAATLPDMPVRHVIELQGPPTAEPTRRLIGDRLTAAKAEFDTLLERGIVRPSSSQWASPLHLVPKPSGGWRATGDYRRLNARTVPDRYPLPIIEDLLQECKGEVFSTIDLRRAFYQIQVNETDIAKTAVTTPFGLFEFVGMPLGLRNSAQTLQRFMNHLLRKFSWARCYVDDILVVSQNHEDHLRHLETLFEALRAANLRINLEKCVLGASEVTYVGFQVSKHGFRPPAPKIDAIANFPKPEDSTQLRRFLGALNYYRRCIPHAAELQAPLNDLLQGLKKKKERLKWTAAAEDAFSRCKKSMVNAVTTVFLEPSAPLSLCTDASSTAIGAALNQQRHDGAWQPLGFFSRKLNPPETRYSTYDRELLAAYSAVRFFRRLFGGQPFTIFTDHRPLVYAANQSSDKATPRQQRHLDFILQHSATFAYLKGEENVVADALSRVCTIDMPTRLDAETIAASQAEDAELPHLLENPRVQLQELSLGEHRLQCIVSDGKVRPYLPLSLRRAAFDIIHGLSHPSSRATAKSLSDKYFWPGVRKDAHQWARECQPCQKSKVYRHNRAELDRFTTPDERFAHIHADIIKLPLCRGWSYCLTIIDRYTRWPVAIPLADMRADTVSRALFNEWICMFGTPLTITSDQGGCFEGQLFHELAKLTGANKIRTTPYHPSSNGLVERLHRSLKSALKCTPETPWPDTLPTVMLGLRTALKEDLQVSPAELVFGVTLRIPGDFFAVPERTISQTVYARELRQLFRALKPAPASNHSSHKPFVYPDLQSCTHVFCRLEKIRKPLDQPYTGPHRVIRRVSDRIFVLDMNGSERTISTDCLKPAYLESADRDDAWRTRTSPPPAPADPPPPEHTASATPRPRSDPHPPRPQKQKKKVSFSSPPASVTGEGVAVAPYAPIAHRTRGWRGRGRMTTAINQVRGIINLS